MSGFQARWDDLRTVLQAVEDRYLAVRLRPAPDWPPHGEERERLKLAIEESCALYLRASDSERDEMRLFFHSTYSLSNYLLGLASEYENRLAETGHIRWIDLALSAASLEDLRTDYRDSYVTVGSIYLTALKAGIDPAPHLQTAARLSSAEKTDGGIATREFFANFEESAYFRESVDKRARRIRIGCDSPGDSTR